MLFGLSSVFDEFLMKSGFFEDLPLKKASKLTSKRRFFKRGVLTQLFKEI